MSGGSEDPENRTLISPATTPGSMDNGVFVTSNYYIPQPTKKVKWYSTLYIPKMLIIISILQILMYYLDLKMDNRLQLILRFEPKKQQELWRFISYMLMHDSWMHLFLNVIPQCFFGIILEKTQPNWKVILVYIGGGIGGALGAVCVRSRLLVGASAGVYAILASNISYYVLNFTMIKYKKSYCSAFIVIIVSDISYTVIHCKVIKYPEISWAAHLFGAVTGCIIGLLFYGHSYQDKNTSKFVRIFAFAILVILIISLIVLDCLDFR
ncbi:PREDICTED: protein rhomboid [Nicrophorus vespilloides]|uniref:Protein rhomboid n=1 Tax=Nicrophorus vespilloides TaxID=110193 RepID=A0ABM1MEW6_NICVS|nr:PREDICTED: protein rhomboid [Nicrophorus vespilloides]XP_017773117.1 PREDICTED: protein rhomboid [Nicrophorus vespilloides]